MAGTMPLSIQVHANDPMRNRIKMDGMAEPILFTIPSCKASQLTPNLNTAIQAAIAEDMITTIRLEPDKPSTPTMDILTIRRITRRRMGSKASKREGLLCLIAINLYRRFKRLKLIKKMPFYFNLTLLVHKIFDTQGINC